MKSGLYFNFIFLFGILTANGSTLVLPENPTKEEGDFAAAIANAVQTTNISALAAMQYYEDDEPWAVKLFFRHLTEKPCDQFRLQRLESANASDIAEVEKMTQGKLRVRWILAIRQPPLLYEATGTNTTLLPVGLHGGQMVITRRMSVFTPFHKKLILVAVILPLLVAVRLYWKFLRGYRSEERPVRYAPLGMAVFFLFCSVEFAGIGFATSYFLEQPKRMFMLPAFGGFFLVASMIHDDIRRRSVTSVGQRPESWLKRSSAPLRDAWKQIPRAKRIMIVVTFSLIFCWQFGRDLARDLVIVIHDRRIQGVVIHAGRHGGIHYRYLVDGREYFGSGVGDSDRYYPAGSPVEVRYSVIAPSLSTIDEPFLTIKQLAVGVLIFGGLFWLADRKWEEDPK